MEILGIGPMELLLILIIALMVFGPDKLPEVGARLGQTLRSVRRATHEFSQEIEETRQAIAAPLDELKQPLNEITQPINDLKRPFEELKQPFQDLKQPFEDLKHPLAEMSQAARDLPVQANQALTLAAGAVESAVAPVQGENGTAPAPVTGAQAGAIAGDLATGAQGSEAAPDIPPAGEVATAVLATADPAIEGAPAQSAATTDGGIADPAPEAPNEERHDPVIGATNVQPVEPSRIATAVINPHEALRQVIARQMQASTEG